MSKDDQKAKVIWPKATFEIQAESEYNQLNTKEDQTGKMPVDHVYKPIREVYGQPPLDLVDVKPIDWTRYGIHMPERPKPEEFPAFQNDKNRQPASEDQGKSVNVEKTAVSSMSHNSKLSKLQVNQPKPSPKKGSKTPKVSKQNDFYECSIVEKSI
ncbi:hypothetical protein DdX_16523 [Ditylenchus destructor]|uniref:Uncharacterized protein n=1 Tax=Ditylenchus destructor TaxID=166010 RepID=A0AAD4MT15_9BILA|nr:hypothetical protein DdX_16523 [Ditylenchus destructor]